MDGRMDGWTAGRTDGRLDGRTDERTDGCMEGRGENLKWNTPCLQTTHTSTVTILTCYSLSGWDGMMGVWMLGRTVAWTNG